VRIHVDGISKAGIGIDQQRYGYGVRDGGNVVCYFRQRGQSDIGRTKVHVGNPGSRDVDGFKAEVLDDPREQAVRCSSENRRLASFENRLERGRRSGHAASPFAAA
jgi:hypothetical protein